MTAHGFRSMASTLLNEQQWHKDAIERQLAHGERDKVRGSYNFAEHLPERRKICELMLRLLRHQSMLADGDVCRQLHSALLLTPLEVWLRSPKGPACLAKLSIGHFERVAIRALTRWR